MGSVDIISCLFFQGNLQFRLASQVNVCAGFRGADYKNTIGTSYYEFNKHVAKIDGSNNVTILKIRAELS